MERLSVSLLHALLRELAHRSLNPHSRIPWREDKPLRGGLGGIGGESAGSAVESTSVIPLGTEAEICGEKKKVKGERKVQ